MYELWSTSSGNLIGAYETESEALEVVRAAIERYGDSYVDDVVLGLDGVESPIGGLMDARPMHVPRPKKIADGRQLAELARAGQRR